MDKQNTEEKINETFYADFLSKREGDLITQFIWDFVYYAVWF
jgi:hypothetical protein